jgi:hypothetical protein
LLPTIRPPSSATTQKKPGFENIVESKPVVTSGVGKSHGKPCAVLILEKASKQICPQAALSSGVALRRTRFPGDFGGIS